MKKLFLALALLLPLAVLAQETVPVPKSTLQEWIDILNMLEMKIQDVLTPPNTPPTANAGSDLEITLPASATLSGGASDAEGAVTSSWSKESGPGDVTFASSASLQTTATFSVAGDYVLALTVLDAGGLPAMDAVNVKVNPEIIVQPPPDPKWVTVTPTCTQSYCVKGGPDKFDANLSKPRPKPWPIITAPSFAGSATGRSWSQWFVEPLVHANSGLFAHGLTLCHARNGSMSVQKTYYQRGNTAEEVFQEGAQQNWLIYEGQRNANAISPYVTFTADNAGKGWWGIDLSGWVYYLHRDGRVGSAAGPQTVVEDGKIFCGERKSRGTFDKPFAMPLDIAENPVNPNVLFIADTGNNRIAKLTWKLESHVADSVIVTHASGFNRPYALDVTVDLATGECCIIFVADRGTNSIKKIAVDGTVSTVTTAADIAWLRIDSKGNIVWLNNGTAQLNYFDLTTNTGRLIARLPSVIDAGPAWKWCDIDRVGVLGPKDDILCVASQTTPSTPVRVSIDGTYSSVGPQGSLLFSGRVNISGIGNMLKDWSGHYGWSMAISRTEARYVMMGVGSMGVFSVRRVRDADPKLFNTTAYNAGAAVFDCCTSTANSSMRLFRGPRGFSRLGMINFDDVMDDMSDAEQTAYIKGGFGMTNLRPLSDQNVKDFKYYACKNSKKGHFQECPY